MRWRSACVWACVWAWAWALLVAAASAQPARDAPPVYPDPPGSGRALTHVGANGLGLETVTLADVESRWGRPESVEAMPYDRSRGRGGHAIWRYPSQGLVFQVNAEDHGDRNPRVGWMQVRLPFAGRTPHGMYLGMPEAEAMSIVERHYRVRYRHTVVWGSYSQERGTSVGVSNQGWRKTQTANFTFRQGRLYSMDFQLKPTPWIPQRVWREAWGYAVLLALAVAGTWLARRLKQGMGVWWGRARSALGTALVLGSAALGWSALNLMQGGDGYAKMAALVLGLSAVGAGLVGLALLAAGWRRHE